jgi:hypothetical protein
LPADRFLGKSPTTISIMVGLTRRFVTAEQRADYIRKKEAEAS